MTIRNGVFEYKKEGKNIVDWKIRTQEKEGVFSIRVQDNDRNELYRQKNISGDKIYVSEYVTDHQPGTAPPLKIVSAAFATSGDW